MGYFTYARGYSPEAYNTTQAISSNAAQAQANLQLAPTEGASITLRSVPRAPISTTH